LVIIVTHRLPFLEKRGNIYDTLQWKARGLTELEREMESTGENGSGMPVFGFSIGLLCSRFLIVKKRLG
jgi:hypothetical protein